MFAQSSVMVISIHALREEGDHTNRRYRSSLLCISIHALREEGDSSATPNSAAARNFYPRPPRGGRHTGHQPAPCQRRFLSTPSARRATALVFSDRDSPIDFYPRPPRGGRQGRRCLVNDTNGISIHALREEGDAINATSAALRCRFLSTPSARRATLRSIEGATESMLFLSTPSARRATFCITCNRVAFLFLSTPSARRATAVNQGDNGIQDISIHALREEGDFNDKFNVNGDALFLSTPSARRAT